MSTLMRVTTLKPELSVIEYKPVVTRVESKKKQPVKPDKANKSTVDQDVFEWLSGH